MTFFRMRSRRMSWADASSQKSGLSTLARTSAMPASLYPTPLRRATGLVLELDARLAQLLADAIRQGEVPRLLGAGALVDQGLNGVRCQVAAFGCGAQVAAGRLQIVLRIHLKQAQNAAQQAQQRGGLAAA